MLTALSISSMHISTVIMLRRMITPISPTVKMVPDNIRKAAVSGIGVLLHHLLVGGPPGDERGIDIFIHGLELPLPDDDGPNHGHQQKQGRDLERHEVIPIQRHPHSLGVADLAATRAG